MDPGNADSSLNGRMVCFCFCFLTISPVFAAVLCALLAFALLLLLFALLLGLFLFGNRLLRLLELFEGSRGELMFARLGVILFLNGFLKKLGRMRSFCSRNVRERFGVWFFRFLLRGLVRIS